jgi:hypothetical protein
MVVSPLIMTSLLTSFLAPVTPLKTSSTAERSEEIPASFTRYTILPFWIEGQMEVPA